MLRQDTRKRRIRSGVTRNTPYQKKRAGKPRLAYPSPYFHVLKELSDLGRVILVQHQDQRGIVVPLSLEVREISLIAPLMVLHGENNED